MKRLPKMLPVVAALLLFASCETSTTEPKATTELPEATTDVLPAESTTDVSPAESTTEVSPAESTPEVVLTVSEKIDQLVSNYADERKEFMGAYRKASSRAERNRIRKELSPDVDQVAGELMTIVDENADDPAAFEALNWVATNVRDADLLDLAMDQLFEKYLDREEMKDICSTLSRGMPSQQVEQRLLMLIEKSPHNDVKGFATFTLAEYLSRLPDLVEFADDPRMANRLGEDGVRYLKNFVQIDEEVETLYTSVINDHPDLMGSRNTLLSDRAEKALFALKYLGIGKVAPDIEGEDLDGEAFKLSEYRGKVVMLDFWGDW